MSSNTLIERKVKNLTFKIYKIKKAGQQGFFSGKKVLSDGTVTYFTRRGKIFYTPMAALRSLNRSEFENYENVYIIEYSVIPEKVLSIDVTEV